MGWHIWFRLTLMGCSCRNLREMLFNVVFGLRQVYLECDPGKNEAVYQKLGYTTVGKEALKVGFGRTFALHHHPSISYQIY